MDRIENGRIMRDAQIQTDKQQGDLIRLLIIRLGKHKVRQTDREQGDPISLIGLNIMGYTDRWIDIDGYTDRQQGDLISLNSFFQIKGNMLIKGAMETRTMSTIIGRIQKECPGIRPPIQLRRGHMGFIPDLRVSMNIIWNGGI
jgi:hypothetical protein